MLVVQLMIGILVRAHIIVSDVGTIYTNTAGHDMDMQPSRRITEDDSVSAAGELMHARDIRSTKQKRDIHEEGQSMKFTNGIDLVVDVATKATKLVNTMRETHSGPQVQDKETIRARSEHEEEVQERNDCGRHRSIGECSRWSCLSDFELVYNRCDDAITSCPDAPDDWQNGNCDGSEVDPFVGPETRRNSKSCKYTLSSHCSTAASSTATPTAAPTLQPTAAPIAPPRTCGVPRSIGECRAWNCLSYFKVVYNACDGAITSCPDAPDDWQSGNCDGSEAVPFVGSETRRNRKSCSYSRSSQCATAAAPVGSTIAVQLLSNPQYLLHCKALKEQVSVAFRNDNHTELDRIANIQATICSLIVQAAPEQYPTSKLLNLTNNKIRVIQYGKSNQYEGNTMWTDNLPGWTSPSTGLHATYIEYIEAEHKMNIRYALAGAVETAIDSSQTQLYVYVKPEYWYDVFTGRGQGCGWRGINIVPSTTTANTSECSWYNFREKDIYHTACSDPSIQPCVTEIAACAANLSTVTSKYVFWIRVGDELMRVVNMDPAPLNDQAWNDKWKASELAKKYHGPNPVWDASYTNGGTGLLARVYAYDPNSYDSSTFWSNNTPFLTERLVGCSSDVDGFHTSDKWQQCLGLNESQQDSSFALEMDGSLVITNEELLSDLGYKRIRVLVRVKAGTVNLYMNGSNFFNRTVSESDGWERAEVDLTPGTYSWRLEYFHPSDEEDNSAPYLRYRIENKDSDSDSNRVHVEAFGPGARSFRYKLTVVRGIDGSIAVPHAAEESVTSPIYEGSSNNYCSDAPYPGGGSTKLTYFSEKNEGAMEYWGELQAQSMTGPNALHGTYYDASGLELPSFNMGDARGRGARPWNFDTDDHLTDAENFEAYTFQYNKIQQITYNLTGEYPVMVANGNGPEYGNEDHANFFVPGRSVRAGIFGHTERGFKVFNGICSRSRSGSARCVAFDHIDSDDNEFDQQWEEEMKDTLYSFQENLGVSMQCKSSYDHVQSPSSSETELTYLEAAACVRLNEYCYGGYLMAKSAGKHTAQVEYHLTTFMGMSTWYETGINQVNATFPVDVDLHKMFRYPLGDPVEEVSHAVWPSQGSARPSLRPIPGISSGPNVNTYRVGNFTYARRYENGLVFVNPYDPDGITPDDINAPGQALASTAAVSDLYSDTLVLPEKMIDAATGTVLDEVTVQGGSARFLLYSPSWNGVVAGADQQYVPYNRAMGLDDYGQTISF